MYRKLQNPFRHLFACVVIVAIVVSNNPTVSAAQTVNVVVDGGLRYQTFFGFGGALAPVEWTGNYRRHSPGLPEKLTSTQADREGIAKLLYQDLGLTQTRLFLSGYEPQNDNNDPMQLNTAALDWRPIVDPQKDFIAAARRFGLQEWWLTFSLDGAETEAWLRLPGSVCQLDPAKIDEMVEWLLAAALHFHDLGLAVSHMAINNEPDFGYCGHAGDHKIEVSDYVQIVKKLGARLHSANLPIKLIVSDGLNPQGALPYMQAVLADADARQYVGVLAYHSYADPYPSPTDILKTSAQGLPLESAVEARRKVHELATQYDLPVWMTEVCVCVPPEGITMSDFELGRARLNHFHDELTIGNISIIDVMNLFFIDRPNVRDELVHIYFRPDGSVERYQIAPYGYLVGHYAKFIPAGSVRVDVVSSDPLVRVTAFVRPDNGLTLVFLNNEPTEVNLRISLNELPAVPVTLSVLASDEKALWQGSANIAVTDSSASITLPPLSVTTISSAR